MATHVYVQGMSTESHMRFGKDLLFAGDESTAETIVFLEIGRGEAVVLARLEVGNATEVPLLQLV